MVKGHPEHVRALAKEINSLRACYNSTRSSLSESLSNVDQEAQRSQVAAYHRVLSTLVPVYRAWTCLTYQSKEKCRRAGTEVILQRRMSLLYKYLKTAAYLPYDAILLDELRNVILPTGEAIWQARLELSTLESKTRALANSRRSERERVELAFMHLSKLLTAIENDPSEVPTIVESAKIFLQNSNPR
jgi:hypothetical protein